MTRRLVAAVSNPRVDVLGHVTGRLVEGSRGTRPQSTFDAEAVFEACAATGVAVEINSRPERQDPPDDLLLLALELGCLFSIDSDAHAPGQLSLIDHGAERAERLGVPAERIVTTWPLDRLREWTTLRCPLTAADGVLVSSSACQPFRPARSARRGFRRSPRR